MKLISIFCVFLAAYVLNAVAAPLEMRNNETPDLELRGPTSHSTTGRTQCPTKKSRRFAIDLPRRSIYDQVAEIFRRDGKLFIGWHGTNADTAALWEKLKEIRKPEGGAGGSGKDHELGPGLYITDTLSTAEAAAAGNQAFSKVKGKVCAIYAKSESAWINVLKVEIPESLRGESSNPATAANQEKMRKQYIVHVSGSLDAAAKFGPLAVGKNQVLIPESLNPSLEAECFDINERGDAPAAHAHSLGALAGVHYTSAFIRQKWRIIPANEEMAKHMHAADAIVKDKQAQQAKDDNPCLIA